MTRVMRYSALLLICLCILSRAWADTVPARILVGTSEAPLAPSPVYDGAGVLAPLQVLALLGATYTNAGDGNPIVTTPNGQSATIKTISINGNPMLPMNKVMALVGGESAWNAANHTLTLTATLDSVEFDNDTLKINCSFPVRAVAKVWDGRIVIDVANTKLASEAKEVYIGAPTVTKARLGQYNATTARVVLETTKPLGCKIESVGSAAQVVARVGEDLPIPPSVTQPAPKQASGQPFTVNGVSVQAAGENSFTITISTTGKGSAAHALKISPPAIEIDLPKAKLADSCAITGAHTLVTPTLAKTASGARLTLKLARPMAYGVEVRGDAIMVYAHLPDKSGGTLAGKLIVIDPGHGGKQGGAPAGPTHEKVINLLLAKDVVAALSKEGARTLLTRDGDQDMGLAARSEVAINSGADFFISLHCNSNLAPGSATGIETYYHFQEPSPKLLACAVHDGVCKFTGMCDRHPRSDRSLPYDTGLAVLRRLTDTGIPGILLECGYVNHSGDRAKLLDPTYRAKLAKGIVAGLKAYIEGTPIE